MLRWGAILNLERFQAQPKWDMSVKIVQSLKVQEASICYLGFVEIMLLQIR